MQAAVSHVWFHGKGICGRWQRLIHPFVFSTLMSVTVSSIPRFWISDKVVAAVCGHWFSRCSPFHLLNRRTPTLSISEVYLPWWKSSWHMTAKASSPEIRVSLFLHAPYPNKTLWGGKERRVEAHAWKIIIISLWSDEEIGEEDVFDVMAMRGKLYFGKKKMTKQKLSE